MKYSKRYFFLSLYLLLLSSSPAESEGDKAVAGMVLIKGGCFQMGDTLGDGFYFERPVHKVCLDDYYLGEHEVTQGEWKEVMKRNPSDFPNTDDNPVENVSWKNAQAFITKLNNITGKKYRLPTEAEWEYAARERGKDMRWSGTNKEEDVGNFAYYLYNARLSTHPVKTRISNDLGLYDMTGNVWEWCSDWYEKMYTGNNLKNPKGPKMARRRVIRGGGWRSVTKIIRVTNRTNLRPSQRANYLGFRLASDAVNK